MQNLKFVRLSCMTCHTCALPSFQQWRAFLPRVCILTQSQTRFFHATRGLSASILPRTDYSHDASKSAIRFNRCTLDFRKFSSAVLRNALGCHGGQQPLSDRDSRGDILSRTLTPGNTASCCLRNDHHKGSSVSRDSFRHLQQRQLTLSPKAIVDASPLSLQPYLKLIRFDRPIGIYSFSLIIYLYNYA